MTQLEIERKYIIRKPAILKDLERVAIRQTYLTSPKGTRRVRSWEKDGVKKYYFTHKKRISALSCEETEREITENEYLEWMRQADPSRTTILKTRYFYPFEGQMFEIDEYPFWQKQCVMEVELTDETQAVLLPADIEIVREVTADKAYKNFALAKAVPEELI